MAVGMHSITAHRYETAAGFFLLAGCLYDGVSVLAKECSDPQLALFVARLVEGTTKQGGAAWQLLQKVGLCAGSEEEGRR